MNQQFQKSECPAATGQNAEQSTDNANLPPAEFLSNYTKRFATLQAKFALKGHAFHQSSRNDGTVDYMAERWGMARYLLTLSDAEKFLIPVGGASHDL